MNKINIANQVFDCDHPGLQNALAVAHKAKTRPACVCRNPAIPMYVAKIAGAFVVKRMPNSGSTHSSACDHYEPPGELSGLGQLIGSAIQENPDAGLTAIKLDFSLKKLGARTADISSDSQADSVKTDGNKLSLRSTLHFLWEEAGFNRWAPAMNGKRSWYVIRKYLLQAAEDKVAKGAGLIDLIYIPESFSTEKKDAISQRRIVHMQKAAPPDKGARHLMIAIGEIKEIAQSRYGHKIIFKHLPDFPFMMNDDIHKRLCKRFEVELGLWDAIETSHLIAIGIFGLAKTGIATLEEVALMCVTDNWIPFEGTYDNKLIDAMTRANRRFVKGMRYNLPDSRPLACLVASDTEPQPTAMYILPPGAASEYANALTTLTGESSLAHWLWDAADVSLPPLPALGLRPDLTLPETIGRVESSEESQLEP